MCGCFVEIRMSLIFMWFGGFWIFWFLVLSRFFECGVGVR